MIRLSEQYAIEPDNHNWSLVKTTRSNPTEKYPEGREVREFTYHPTLQACLKYWVEIEPKKAESILELTEAILKMHKLITTVVEPKHDTVRSDDSDRDVGEVAGEVEEPKAKKARRKK